jgi:IclR family acetate operon transcriptional repressor
MQQNHSPIVDKAMMLLGVVGSRRSGISMAGLVEHLGVPRSTVYRILNSLLAHRFVVRKDGGLFALGPRIHELAGTSPPNRDWSWLVRLAAPILQQLAADLGEAVKLGVVEGDGVVTIHAVSSEAEHGLAVRIGHRTPLHIGGTGKVVLAFMPEDEAEQVLAGHLMAYTSASITNPKALRSTLKTIRERGYAEDFGEMTQSIRSFAAPIFDGGDGVLGAVSVPFLGEVEPERAEAIRDAVLAAGTRINAAIRGQG